MLVVLVGLSYHLIQASFPLIWSVELLIRRADLWTEFIRKGAAEAEYASAVYCKRHRVLSIPRHQPLFVRLSWVYLPSFT